MDTILYELQDDLTPEFILQRIPEEAIYERYLKISPEIGILYRNPLRDDKNPTCSFGHINGKLVFRDWSEPIYMDVFDVVQRRYQVGFHQSLNIIASDFGLTDGDVPAPIYSLPSRKEKPTKPIFTAQVQPFSLMDTNYLAQFGITPTIANKFNVFSIRSFQIDGRPTYERSDYDPALGYYFGLNSRGQQKWKIYFYSRTRKKFLGNTSRTNGWIQLPPTGRLVVLTKSLKDVMSLYRLGIPAVATQGEGIAPRKELIDELRMRFSYLATLYDFDRVGITMAAKIRREYGIPAFMLTDGRMGSIDYQSKDISDYIQAFGLQKAQKLTRHAIENLIYGTPTNRNYSPVPVKVQNL